MEILKIENLSFTYPMCPNPTVKDISFSVERGEFISVIGATGSGKTTLLRMLKRELAPLGEKSGTVYFESVPTDELSPERSACSIGFVMQNPEHQIVTDTVWHELAFGLENMNMPRAQISRRVAEVASYFGIEEWYEKKVCTLSGGQKQLLTLAAVIAMDPKIIILDEPTAQLDPIAASEFIATLRKINRELALTVIITEHRLEEVISASDKLVLLEDGGISAIGSPREVIKDLAGKPHLLCAMPAATRLYHKTAGSTVAQICPVDIREGRRYIEENFGNDNPLPEEKPMEQSAQRPALEFEDVYFRYEKDQSDVLRDLSLTVYENETFCILGGNGTGKTTALSAAADLIRPYSGYIKVFGKKLKEYKNRSLYRGCLSLLPQDVQTVFLKNTVREELADAKAEASALPFDTEALYDKHPYDLSGGQQQLLALAKVLGAKPRLLLLDEPTKGIDTYAKLSLCDILRKLKANGMTVVIVTHDIEFAAMCADRCALFFRGQAVSVDKTADFFSGSSFYTTAAARMTRGYFKNAVTVDDAARLCELNRSDGGVG